MNRETPLEKRIKRFDVLVSRFSCERPHPLIAIAKIPDNLFRELQVNAALFMSKSLPSRRIHLQESDIMEAFQKERELIKNCTPNGLLVPKRHLSLCFNSVIGGFAAIVDSLNIGDLIDSWHVPLNIRFKDPRIRQENIGRPYATEAVHSDSWAGESSLSITTWVPIFGDTENNGLRLYAPPLDFQEEWLGFRRSYSEGEEIAKRYTVLDTVLKKGFVYLGDFATLHKTWREEGCGPRVSIDTTFVPNISLPGVEKIHEWRIDERASHEDLRGAGETTFFVFPRKEDDPWVDNKGGGKHPTELYIRRLLDE